MSRSKIRIQGLRTPRPLLYFHGCIDRRTNAAHLDPNTGLLISAFLSRAYFQFSAYSQQKAVCLENTLAATRTEAESLILEFSSLPSSTDHSAEDIPPVPRAFSKVPSTPAEARTARAAAQKEAQLLQTTIQSQEERRNAAARRTQIRQRLMELRERLRTREQIIRYELDAIASALQARFCAYARGVLQQPVHKSQIPPLDYDLSLYYASHNDLQARIAAVLERKV